MMASLRLPLLLVFFLVFAAPVRSQDRIPLDPAITTGTLDNGLSYIIRANDTPDNRAELRLVLNAGSILEDDDQLGLAHFVEHMAFNGTASFEEQALVEYLESIGMRFGADINAYTSFDETVYMLEVPTDDAQTLDTGLRILREWAGGIAFDPEEIDKERGVVIEEWRLRQGGANRIVTRQYPVLLNGSRYPERLPIGTEENLRTFDHESLLRYYTDWYRPDLMTVIAVGDFDAQAIESRVQELF
ncbi:MAG: M16 family metallopeptidase, partial [Rhodothermales bacterium]